MWRVKEIVKQRQPPNKMKKGWIIALSLLLVGLIGAFIWYNRLKKEAASEGGAHDNTLKPRLEMSTVNITDIDEDRIKMNVGLLIDNPLPVSFEANRLAYTVLIANTPVVKDTYAKPIVIKSGDSTIVTLPVEVFNKKLTSVLETLHRKGIDSTTYTVHSTFDLDVPILGERTFHTTINRRLPTFYIPKVKIEDLDFGKLGLKRTDVAAKVAITNQNKFPLMFTDTHYTVSVDGKEIAEGVQREPIIIKKQATTPVIFPVTVKPGESLSLLPKMLFDKKNTPVLVVMRCKLIDKDSSASLNNSKMKMVVRGMLSDFKK